MKLTCNQFEILISFYIENELSPCLREKFEEHIKECENCSSKYSMIKDLFTDMKKNIIDPDFDINNSSFTKTHKFGDEFNTQLSAYIDNELTSDENIKIKKLTITNKDARKELENSYHIRRLMSDSFKKSKEEAKNDYSKNILKQLQIEEEARLGFHPAINLLITFTVCVLVITTIVLISLNA